MTSDFSDFGGELHLGGKVMLFNGDSRDVLKGLPDNSIDSIVTDPPYALVSIVKRFGKENPDDVERNFVDRKTTGQGVSPYERAARGFMGKSWDTGETAFAIEFWAEVMRVLKPGGHVIAASGTRTYHRLAVAIEDAGFEIRDMVVEYIESNYALNAFFNSLNDEQKGAFVKLIDEQIFGGIFGWVYGSGFPKSHSVDKAIDKINGVAGEASYTGANHKNEVYGEGMGGGHTLAPYAPASADRQRWQGWGTALKPAIEPWVLARKPLAKGLTVAGNVLEHGTGALNIDGCRVGVREKPKVTDPKKTSGTYGEIDSPGGKLLPDARWPANVIHDGSAEVVDAFPGTGGNQSARSASPTPSPAWAIGGERSNTPGGPTYADAGGSAARFFYSAKADALDRIGSKHPTVKPVDLMQYLCRLITPPGGIVLDPFAGSGTTGEAAWREGFRCVLVEREVEYADDIRERLRLANTGTGTKKRAIAVKKSKGEELGGLFA